MLQEQPCRPELNPQLDCQTFRRFYYLKEELVAFCRENGLPVSGGKIDLANRIAHFLDTGGIIGTQPKGASKKSQQPRMIKELTEESIIEPNFVCSERHRAFFKERIGPKFTFNVSFQKWLKTNPGKTYSDAIDAYNKILEEKKLTKTIIDPQFEYNAYIRAFFAANPSRPLSEAIQCWKYKKSLPGHNRYEDPDLEAL